MINLSKVKRYSIKSRRSKVKRSAVARPAGIRSISDFVFGLPDFLAAADLKKFLSQTLSAVRKKKKVLLMMGAHPIKCGLSLHIIEMLKKGIITDIALNGAGIIHDFEMACCGATSEDVAENLKDGSFGFAEETGKIINGYLNASVPFPPVGQVQQASREGEGRVRGETGLGSIMGRAFEENRLKYRHLSILASAYSLNVGVTVHCAIGSDIIYQHPECRGELWGKESYNDFLKLAETVSGLEGGVVMAFGSAVIMPEVFLKALSISRNLYKKPHKFVTAYFDMIKQYRPQVNIVSRPTAGAGTGYYFTGHHEIMLPLVAGYLLENIPFPFKGEVR